MAAFARDILNYKYYKDSDGGQREIIDKFLIDEKRKQPSRYVTASVLSNIVDVLLCRIQQRG